MIQLTKTAPERWHPTHVRDPLSGDRIRVKILDNGLVELSTLESVARYDNNGFVWENRLPREYDVAGDPEERAQQALARWLETTRSVALGRMRTGLGAREKNRAVALAQ